MKLLGINFGHDASLTYISDGKIIFSIEEEKTSRTKQDFGWPKTALDRLYKEYQINAEDIDVIAFGGRTYDSLNKNEIKYRFYKNQYDKNKEIIDRALMYFGLSKSSKSGENIQIFKEELIKLGFSKAKVEFYNHHLCHAVSAYYASPFKCDLIYTSDGHGDGESITFYKPDGKGNLSKIKSFDYTTSIGQFYSAITKLLGFRPTRHEGKITGLAGYGKDSNLLNLFRDLFKFEKGKLTRFPFENTEVLFKTYGLDQSQNLKSKINYHSESEIGSSYSRNAMVLDAWLKEVTQLHSKEDIAYACQKVSEEVSYKLLNYIIDNHFNDKQIKLGLAGGVFANVRINQILFEHKKVENVFIQPAMGDSGLSLGAAVLANIEFSKKIEPNQFRFEDTYIGPNYSLDLKQFIDGVDSTKYEVISLGEKAPRTVAQLMANNKIVGFWHGSMEWGPRALGKRSMILNTFDRAVNDTLNKRLNRTEFMPFAPSVIDYMVKVYMPKYEPQFIAADYMTMTYDVAPEFHEQLQAVVHVDGTARPQVVKKETNPYYYDIIDEFYKITGCGAIVNTSFNVHEEPIVSTPASAFKALEDDRIDVLILDRYMINKR